MDKSRVELQHPLWGIVPYLYPPHVWDLLEALWIDVLVCGLMCQLNKPPDRQVGSMEAHFSFRSTLIDSPSAIAICLLGICAPRGLDLLFFWYK